MELRQLEYLVAVAEEANFTRAAERLHVAQPGVSAQVRRLERELGHELLDRSGRSVTPTAVGAAVLPHARAALAAVAAVGDAVDEMAGLVRGRVALGTVTSHDVDLPALLADFHRDHPAVEIVLTEDASAGLADAVREGRLDAAILSVGPNTPPELDLTTVVADAVVAAVGHDDPLAGSATVPLDALRDRELISLPPGSGIRSHLEAACAAAGFVPRVAFEASRPESLAGLAARGLGVAVLPAGLAASRPELHTLRIVEPELRGGLALATRSGGPSGPAARVLVERARQMIAERVGRSGRPGDQGVGHAHDTWRDGSRPTVGGVIAT